MKLLKLFEEQIKKAIPLTEEQVTELLSVKDPKDTDIKVGDVFLWYFEEAKSEDGKNVILDLKRVTERTIDKLCLLEYVRHANTYPVFKQRDI